MHSSRISREQLQELAEQNIQKFTKTMIRLFSRENENYDVMVACGNTGSYMTALVQIILRQLQKDPIEVVSIPLQRFCNEAAKEKFDASCSKKLKHLSKQLDPTSALPEIIFDNSVLLPELREANGNLDKCRKILFVDDEIQSSVTIRMALDLLREMGKIERYAHITIVAENHNLMWPYHDPEMFLHFLPYGMATGINNLVTFAASDEALRALEEYFGDELKKTQYVNLLLGVPLKIFDGEKPYFTFRYHEIAQSEIAGFEEMAREHVVYLELLIRNVLPKA